MLLLSYGMKRYQKTIVTNLRTKPPVCQQCIFKHKPFLKQSIQKYTNERSRPCVSTLTQTLPLSRLPLKPPLTVQTVLQRALQTVLPRTVQTLLCMDESQREFVLVLVI